MTSHHIDSRMEIGAKLPEFDTDTVKNEPMLFSCDVNHAYALGGPITEAFLNTVIGPMTLDPANTKFVFDSRVHMLMDGWYPCIPGFHHDDVDRHSTPNGQPNYTDPTYRSKCAMALVGDDICRTEFAIGKGWFHEPEDDITYKVWHEEVTERIKIGELYSETAPMGNVLYFDDRTWHQGTASTGRGWRWFGRLTATSGDDTREPFNEVRRQVQVYLEKPMQGW